MSGKSTFPQNPGPPCWPRPSIPARRRSTGAAFSGSHFNQLKTALRKEKVFISEGKPLKLIDTAAAGTDAPALCIIDELLRHKLHRTAGRIEAILNYLAGQNALVIVATHDLDLAEKLQGLYRCCHFTDQVGPAGLHFDYKLKDGLAATRNAIRLLAYLGYPREIVEQAGLQAEQFVKKEK